MDLKIRILSDGMVFQTIVVVGLIINQKRTRQNVLETVLESVLEHPI